MAITAIVSAPALGLAGSYQALCAGTKCTVVVGPDVISSPYGSIPTNRVTNWGGGGDTSTQVGTGVATTILFGPIGLLGFLAKKHDFNFVVNGYDADGKKASLSLQFKNDKPAKRFINEMQQVTQLGMGQTRTAKEIMAAESSASTLSTGTLEGDAQLQESGLNSKTTDLAPSSNSNCWSKYLENNPAMKEWAEANPGMAAQNKKRFDDC
ncbi:hypothetical protein [Synechococcus sp. MU1648]|uniref:hypothetical protein n=1 Tax=Synechococcus sp. MU1648 TaxID=2508351 RepID=UPI0020270CCD|nr:hypothetical protein [Synechococcus sp. MU1648]